MQFVNPVAILQEVASSILIPHHLNSSPGIVFLFSVINNKKIKSRKTFSILLWVLLISLVVYFALPSVSVDIMPIVTIPVSYIMSHYFIFIRKKLVSEIVFSLYFVFIILIQIWSVK